jgi:outer membrane lipoprotein SlyB
MANETIFPQGTAKITVPATESIAISNFGGGIAKIYYLIEDANRPDAYQFQQNLNDSSVTLGAFSVSTTVKIEAGNSKVIYSVGAAPDTGVGDADTLGGLLPTQFIRSDTADDVNDVLTYTVGPVINNTIYITIKESGGTARAVIGIDGSNIFQVGNTNNTTNIKSSGSVIISESNINMDNNRYIVVDSAAGSPFGVLGMNASNVFLVGTSTYPMNIRTNGTLQYNGASLASGTIDTAAAQTITVVDGLITAIA